MTERNGPDGVSGTNIRRLSPLITTSVLPTIQYRCKKAINKSRLRVGERERKRKRESEREREAQPCFVNDEMIVADLPAASLALRPDS